jgi:hypothetical protein
MTVWGRRCDYGQMDSMQVIASFLVYNWPRKKEPLTKESEGQKSVG